MEISSIAVNPKPRGIFPQKPSAQRCPIISRNLLGESFPNMKLSGFIEQSLCDEKLFACFHKILLKFHLLVDLNGG